jgi:hypothetical protein
MMRRVICISILLCCMSAVSKSRGGDVLVWYDVNDLGSGQWEYTYSVRNQGLEEPIEEFTIWFDFGLYENLTVTTPDPPSANWNEIIVQPEPYLHDDGFYDALALGAGIDISEMVTDFSVSFNWLGSDEPGPQHYEIINPATYETIADGWTIPEPASAIVMSVGGVLMAAMRRGRR